jgi:hypothetical protein
MFKLIRAALFAAFLAERLPPAAPAWRSAAPHPSDEERN